MTYSDNMEIQQHGMKIKVEDDQEQVSIACSHDFWNEAPEDVLTEIFIRHPDSRSALRTTTVCRRWCSLISRNPDFIERFKSHHRRHHHRYPPESLPWAFVFRPNLCSEANICHVSSNEWLFLHGKLPDNCFDFLPNSSRMHIKSSCNDLFLLVSRPKDDNDYHYMICNPITKQFVYFPAGPPLDDHEWRGVIGYAVIRAPPGPTDNIRFKVVRVRLFYSHYQHDGVVQVAVFCSMSRKWETRSVPGPGLGSGWYGYHKLDNIVTIDGVLCWLGTRDNRQILVYLDLEKELCGTISIPWPADTICDHVIGALPVSGGSHELRLLQVDVYTKKIVYVTVWRLNNNNINRNNDDSKWILVHSKRTLARPENLCETSCSFKGVFVHPTNGDFVLYVWGKNVIEYNLVDATYKKIVELPRTDSWSIENPFLMVGASDSTAGLDF